MQKYTRILVLAALAGLVFWSWRTLFPNPERIIRSRLDKLAKAASFSPSDGAFSKLSYAHNLAGFCTTNVEITVNGPGHEEHSLNGWGELLHTAAAVRATWRGLDAKFVDINISLAPDKQSATVNLTAEAKVAGEQSLDAQELKFTLQKVDGKWLIRRIETVKTFSHINAGRFARLDPQ